MSPPLFRRTELIEGTEHAEAVDAEIAATLRRREGAWSQARLRICAIGSCSVATPTASGVAVSRPTTIVVWVDTGREHGMAALGASMSAENARIAFESVKSARRLRVQG